MTAEEYAYYRAHARHEPAAAQRMPRAEQPDKQWPDLPEQLPEGIFRFQVDLIEEKDKAYLLDFDGDRHWIPKSQCTLGWAPGVTCQDWIFAADLKTWIVDQKKLL